MFNKSDKATKPLSSGAKNPPKTSPDIEENLKLLLDHDSIIRASTKIENAAPHIYERVNKAGEYKLSRSTVQRIKNELYEDNNTYASSKDDQKDDQKDIDDLLNDLNDNKKYNHYFHKTWS